MAGFPAGIRPFEAVGMEDAEYAVIALGSAFGTIRTIVENMRSAVFRSGMIKLRAYRPFPAQRVGKAFSGLKAVAVFDRSAVCRQFGRGGIY